MGKLAMLMLEDLNTAVKTEDLTLIKKLSKEIKILMTYTSILLTQLI